MSSTSPSAHRGVIPRSQYPTTASRIPIPVRLSPSRPSTLERLNATVSHAQAQQRISSSIRSGARISTTTANAGRASSSIGVQRKPPPTPPTAPASAHVLAPSSTGSASTERTDSLGAMRSAALTSSGGVGRTDSIASSATSGVVSEHQPGNVNRPFRYSGYSGSLSSQHQQQNALNQRDSGGTLNRTSADLNRRAESSTSFISNTNSNSWISIDGQGRRSSLSRSESTSGSVRGKRISNPVFLNGTTGVDPIRECASSHPQPHPSLPMQMYMRQTSIDTTTSSIQTSSSVVSSYRDIPPSTPEEVGHHQRGNSSGDPNEGGRGDGYPGSALKSKFSVSPDTRSRSRSRKQIKLRPKDRGTGTSGTAGASAGAGAGAGVGGDTSVRPGSAAQPEKGFKSKTSFPKIGLGWSSGKKEKEKGKLKEKENERREGERDDGRTSSEQAKRNPLSDITNTTASRSGLINLMTPSKLRSRTTKSGKVPPLPSTSVDHERAARTSNASRDMQNQNVAVESASQREVAGAPQENNSSQSEHCTLPSTPKRAWGAVKPLPSRPHIGPEIAPSDWPSLLRKQEAAAAAGSRPSPAPAAAPVLAPVPHLKERGYASFEFAREKSGSDRARMERGRRSLDMLSRVPPVEAKPPSCPAPAPVPCPKTSTSTTPIISITPPREVSTDRAANRTRRSQEYDQDLLHPARLSSHLQKSEVRKARTQRSMPHLSLARVEEHDHRKRAALQQSGTPMPSDTAPQGTQENNLGSGRFQRLRLLSRPGLRTARSAASVVDEMRARRDQRDHPRPDGGVIRDSWIHVDQENLPEPVPESSSSSSSSRGPQSWQNEENTHMNVAPPSNWWSTLHMNLKMRKQKSLGNLRLQAGKGTERSLSKDVPMVPEAETLPRNATAAEVSAAIKLRKSEDLLRERAWEQQVESGVEQKASKSADLSSPSPCEHEREHNVDANADAEIQSFRLRLLIASGGSKKRRPPIPVFRVEAPTPAADRRSGGPMASSSRSSIPRINTALSSSSLPRASREGRAKLREAKETKDAPTVVIAGPPSKGTPLKSPHSAASARSGALSLPIPPRTRRSRAGTISSESGSTNSSDSGLDSDSGVGTEREDAQMQDRTERSIMTVGSSILEKGARLSFLESPNEPLPSSDSWPNGRRASTKKTAHPARADDHDDGDAASLRAGDSSELRSFPPAPTPPPCMPLPALPRICHSTFGDDEFDSRNEKRPEESKDKEDDHVRRAERIPMAAPENEREPNRASLYSVASTALGLDTELRIAELLELEIDSSCSILARGADVPAQPASKDDASELANIHNPARALKHSNKQFEQSVDGRHSRLSDADVATDVLSHLVERFQDGSHSPARVASNPNARPQIDPIEEGDLPDLEDEDGSGSDLDVMTYASTSVRSSSSEDVDDDDLQSLIDGILDSNEGSPAKARASPRSHSHSPPVAEAGEVVRRLSASSAGTDFTWPPPIQQIVQGTMGALPRASASRQSQRLRRSCSGEAFEAAGDTSLPSVQPSTYCGSESGSESQYDDDDDDDKSSYAGDSTLDHGGRDLTEDMTGASFGLEDSPCPPPRAYRQDGRGGASGPVREMLFRSNQLELGKLGPDKGGKEVLGSMQFNHAQNLHLTQSANTNELGESKTGALGAQSKTRAESALKLSKEKMDPVDRISPRERSSDLEPARAHGALSIDPFNLDLQVSLARVPESCETTFFTACQEQTPRGLFKTSGPPLPLSPPSSRKPTGKQTALFDRVEHSQDTRAPCKPPPQLLAPFEDTPLSSSERPSAFLIKLEGVQAKLNNKRLSSQEDTSEDSPSALALRRALQRKPSVSEEHDEPGTKPKAKFGRTSPTGSTSSCRASLSSARSTSPALIQTARIVPTARGRPSNIFNSEKAGVVTAPPVSVESAQQLDGSAVIEAEGEATLAHETTRFRRPLSMSAQRRRSRHAGPSSVRPSCLANIAEPLPSLSSPKKGLGGQDAVKTSVEGQWPPQSARVDDPPEAGVPAYESDAETKENPMDDSAEYLLEEQLPPRRLDHLIADTKRDLASSKEKYPDTEFTDWLLSVFQPPRTAREVLIFVLDSQSMFRPLSEQGPLGLPRLTERDFLATPERWTRPGRGTQELYGQQPKADET